MKLPFPPMLREAQECGDRSGVAQRGGVRAVCIAEAIGAGRGLQPERLDAWLALGELPLALHRWFGEWLTADRATLLLALDRDIAQIDELLAEQVDAILHTPAFQRLEARWHGLRYLTEVAEGSALSRIRVLTVSWTEIVKDLERAADFDQSQMFRKIYTEEFGTLGGEPFGLLVGDYEVQHSPSAEHPSDDVAALKSLAMIAAAAFAPLVVGVAPALFKVDSFRELGRPFDLRAVFGQVEYQRWQAMREGADMRFVGLVMPRILMRLPYRYETTRRDGFRFREKVHAPRATDYLWGNAAFAFAAVTLRAFANFGWFADIRGAPDDEIRGGLVSDLPVPSFGTDAPGVTVKPSTECVLSDQQEKDLSDLGFIALRRVQYTSYSAFYANQSIQVPARYDQPAANINARLSCMLQYMLCVSRFAHYVKIIGRNCIGTMMTAGECEQFLQSWLLNYCEGSDDASLDQKARYPLREAAIEIKETAGQPGAYSCKLFLRPHFQLDDIATGFRLVTQLAPPAAAA